MYQTRLDIIANQIAIDLYNHKYYRPLIVVDDQQMYHLLIPDIPIYIFNFLYESWSEVVDKNLYNIDLLSQKYLSSLYAYPWLVFLNGYKGIEEIADKQIFIPKRFNDYVNKYRNKYTEPEYEVENELQEELEFQEEETVQSSTDLKSIFGPLFVEA